MKEIHFRHSAGVTPERYLYHDTRAAGAGQRESIH